MRRYADINKGDGKGRYTKSKKKKSKTDKKHQQGKEGDMTVDTTTTTTAVTATTTEANPYTEYRSLEYISNMVQGIQMEYEQEKKPLTFEQLCPIWYSKFQELEQNVDIFHKYGEAMNDSSACVVAEAYGFKNNYVDPECVRSAAWISHFFRYRDMLNLNYQIKSFLMHWNLSHHMGYDYYQR